MINKTLLFKCRQSMRFAKHLREASDRIRNELLNSNDIKDKTVLDEDWTSTNVNPFVGNYLIN